MCKGWRCRFFFILLTISLVTPGNGLAQLVQTTNTVNEIVTASGCGDGGVLESSCQSYIQNVQNSSQPGSISITAPGANASATGQSSTAGITFQSSATSNQNESAGSATTRVVMSSGNCLVTSNTLSPGTPVNLSASFPASGQLSVNSTPPIGGSGIALFGLLFTTNTGASVAPAAYRVGTSLAAPSATVNVAPINVNFQALVAQVFEFQASTSVSASVLHNAALYIPPQPAISASGSVTISNPQITAPSNVTVQCGPLTLSKVSGDNQTAPVLAGLPKLLVVRVVDQNNQPVSGTTINWAITGPAGGTGQSVGPPTITTGPDGTAHAIVQLGSLSGVYQITATCPACTSGSPAIFTAMTSGLLPPTISLDYSPKPQLLSGLLPGAQYNVVATVTNHNRVPISVQFMWSEGSSSAPGISPPPLFSQGPVTLTVDSIDDPFTHGVATKTLCGCSHTWQWLDGTKTGYITTLLKVLGPTIKILEHVGQIKAIITPIKDVLPGGSLISIVTDVHQVLSIDSEPFFPTLTLSYSVISAQWDLANTSGYRFQVPPRLPNISVPYSITQLKIESYDKFKTQNYNGALALISGELPGLPVFIALPLFVTGFALEKSAELDYEDAADPPDFNFTQIVQPAPLIVPELATIPASPIKALANKALAIQGFNDAQTTSLNRAAGAALANNPTWQAAQLLAAARYAADAQVAETRLIALLSQLTPFFATLAPQATNAVATLQSQGLPPIVVKYLTQAGWTPQELDQLRQAIAQNDIATTLLGNPASSVLAGQLASVLTMANIADTTAEAIAIRTGPLGQTVRNLTPLEQQNLTSMQTSIQAGLTLGIPSNSLLAQILAFQDAVRQLIVDTNNPTTLASYIQFGQAARLTFEQFNVSLAGLQALVMQFVQTGDIFQQGIANSLLDKLLNAQIYLLQGDFEASTGILGAFRNEVQAQANKHITQQAADALTAYAQYILSLSSS